MEEHKSGDANILNWTVSGAPDHDEVPPGTKQVFVAQAQPPVPPGQQKVPRITRDDLILATKNPVNRRQFLKQVLKTGKLAGLYGVGVLTGQKMEQLDAQAVLSLQQETENLEAAGLGEYTGLHIANRVFETEFGVSFSQTLTAPLTTVAEKQPYNLATDPFTIMRRDWTPASSETQIRTAVRHLDHLQLPTLTDQQKNLLERTAKVFPQALLVMPEGTKLPDTLGDVVDQDVIGMADLVVRYASINLELPETWASFADQTDKRSILDYLKKHVATTAAVCQTVLSLPKEDAFAALKDTNLLYSLSFDEQKQIVDALISRVFSLLPPDLQTEIKRNPAVDKRADLDQFFYYFGNTYLSSRHHLHESDPNLAQNIDALTLMKVYLDSIKEWTRSMHPGGLLPIENSTPPADTLRELTLPLHRARMRAFSTLDPYANAADIRRTLEND